MARPILGKTVIVNDVGVIGGDLISGSLKITSPDCEVIRFSIQFDPDDILHPDLVASFMLQERKDGQAAYGDLKQHNVLAIGAIDNETSPTLMDVGNPFISTTPPRRRFHNSEVRYKYNLAGRPGGVNAVVTALMLGADDGIPDPEDG